MSEKKKDNIIKFPQAEITDEDFEVFMNALFGPYKGGGFQQE
jgi:hypothetical protein